MGRKSIVLFCMDDLEFYAVDNKELKAMLLTVHKYTKRIDLIIRLENLGF